MNTYIALFRGINVGGNNILPMKSLVEILEGIGCSNIRTYIQSGNAVFQFKKENRQTIAEKISQKVLGHFQFEPKVLILELADLQVAVKNNPYERKDGKALHFFFLESAPENPDLDGLAAIKSNSEEFKLINKVFYLYAPDGIGRSKLAAKAERSLRVAATGRNWNTVSKLLEMVGQK
ncbi:MAG: DUF1697 domain-containing protein [Bacteroidales bacterium]|nr:DUF1697 domain-containing protein [Bacteroidales bacterium]MCF8456721.1 DUF1697 domain-containing protein [Bacteroidales bacterium]